jgi:hypothetical protein
MRLSEGIFKYRTVEEEIRRYSSQYSACFSINPNDLIVNLMEQPEQAIAKTPAK